MNTISVLSFNLRVAVYERDTEDRRIDYVLFAGDGLRLLDAAIDHATRGGAHPSDHHPLQASFAW